MPELPEVETLKRALAPLILNKRLLEVKFLRRNLRFPIPSKKIKQGLLNQFIFRLTRKGKYILAHTSGGALLIHLGMSGRITQTYTIKPVEKHTHVIFKFEPNLYLHYVDPRRFGCFLWTPFNQQDKHPLLSSLGPDPLDKDTSAKKMRSIAEKCHRKPIKAFLMDSKRIAGIGNIYANETLFASKVHPKKPANKIGLKKWEEILSSLRYILNKSIVAGGTTLRDFHNAGGEKGYYQFNLSVYGKESLPCPVCTTSIKKIVQSGRSTFFCKKCQK